MDTNELIITSDGSHSILSSQFEVSYHSRHGAIGETQHVFINAGLLPKMHLAQIHVLGIGFGTGLNVMMSLLEAKKSESKFYYEAIEAFPISVQTADKINYADLLQIEHDVYMRLHKSAWDETHELLPNFSFQKKLARFETFESDVLFDVIFFDAFAPSAQPELWDTQLLGKMYDLLKPDGVLTTYCAQGQFKRNLKAVGFTIEPLPGPPGKREMTRARKAL